MCRAVGFAMFIVLLLPDVASAMSWWGLTPGTSSKADVTKIFGTPVRTLPSSPRAHSGLVFQGAISRERGAEEAQFYFDEDGVLTDIFVFPAARIGRNDVIKAYGTNYEEQRHDGRLYLRYRSEGFIVFFEKDEQWVLQLQFTSQKSASGTRPSTSSAKEPKADRRLGSGSGVFVSADGHILTAAHVVEDATRILVVAGGGDPIEATLVKIDAANDLAILKVEVETPVKPLRLGSPSSVSLGSSVYTVGYPNILVQGVEPKFTQGVVNSLAGIQDDPRMFQMSAEVQPGNSGGPLVNDRGEVVGVVVSRLAAAEMIRISGDLPQNVNYAIKSSYATILMEDVPALAKRGAPSKSATQLKTEDIARRTAAASVLVLVEK